MAPVMVLLLLATASAIRNGAVQGDAGQMNNTGEEQAFASRRFNVLWRTGQEFKKLPVILPNLGEGQLNQACSKRTHTASQKEHKLGCGKNGKCCIKSKPWKPWKTSSVAHCAVPEKGERCRLVILVLGLWWFLALKMCASIRFTTRLFPPLGVHAHSFFRPFGAETLFGASFLHDLGRLLWLQSSKSQSNLPKSCK